MAIGITNNPDGNSAINSKTVITATSTNSGNDGFVYEVDCVNEITGETVTYFVPPNPHGNLVFEPNNTYRAFVRNNPCGGFITSESVHQLGVNSFDYQFFESYNDEYFRTSGIVKADIRIFESWQIAGVQTRNVASEQIVEFYYYNVALSVRDGVNTPIADFIGLNQDRIMSDRDINTSTWDMAESFGLNSDAIFIPTYESDWGVWNVRQSSLTTGMSNITKVRLGILPNSGAPVQQDWDLGIEAGYVNLPFWPANLNALLTPGILKPQDYPNWKAIYFQFLDASDAIITKSYVMYNAERDGNCERFDKIRIAWVGRRGGWEYHNFIMKSEESYVTDKVIAQRVLGNYGQVDYDNSVGFIMPRFAESEVVVDLKIQNFVTANSDWLTEGEFEFLKGLFLSKQVHWVQDDGSHIPVILEANGYEVKRQFTQGKLYNQQIKFKIAQEQFN